MDKVLVPSLGESVTEATIAKWYKKEGDNVEMDELLLELETDKVTLEVNASSRGVIAKILKNEGDKVEVGAVVCHIDNAAQKDSSASQEHANKSSKIIDAENTKITNSQIIAPSARKMIIENQINPNDIINKRGDGRILKEDVINHLSNINTIKDTNSESVNKESIVSIKEIERVKMSALRKTIATRLKDAQNTAAILTTFNEIDMSNVIEMRSRHKDEFLKKHDTKLGFMSFFVTAAVKALQMIPAVNAEIDGDEIIYKNYYDIGVAVGSKNGLVVPVLRNAQDMSMPVIESKIVEYAKKARDGKLSMSEMLGGTFTISNGGVYGSLMSTPIINPPQSGILGLHKIQERPVCIDGKIEARPMMYVALSYDHRIIDGQEAVTFLVKIKDMIENPERILLNI